MCTNAALWRGAIAASCCLVFAACSNEAARPVTPPAPEDLSRLDPALVEVVGQAIAYVRRAPHEAYRWAKLGMLYESNSQPDLAMRCYRRAAKLDGSEPRWWYRIALMLHYGGDVAGGLETMDRVIELNAKYAPALWRRGLWLLELGRHEEALASLRRAYALDPSDRGARLGLARALLVGGENEEAVDLLEAHTREHPDDRYGFHLLGTAYRQGGHVEKARAALVRGTGSEAQWRDPWYDEVLGYRVGFTADMRKVKNLYAAGDAKGIIALLEPWYEKRPDDVALLNHLGMAYTTENRLDKAFEVLNRAAAKFPNHYATYLNLATAHERGGDSARALAAIDRAIELNPMLGKAYETRGIILWRSGRLEEALTALQESVRRDARSPMTVVWVGMVQSRLGRWADAAASFERVLRVDPTAFQAQVGLALVRIEQGEIDAAAACLNAAAELNPNAPELIGARRRLLEKRSSSARPPDDNPDEP